MADLRIASVDEADVDTILAEDIDFRGDLSFTNALIIKGRFRGEVDAKGDLYVGEHANIEATVSANLVSLKGSVSGNIFAASRVELFSTASVAGDINAPEVVMESGSKFNGKCVMEEQEGDKGDEVEDSDAK